MIGKLIIQGKAWGEFESAKRSKGNIEISGYRSYGGTHTVRMVDQPQLNENQQQVLGWLKIGHCDGDRVFEALERITYVYEDPKTEEALESLSPDQEVQVINSFMKWTLEQEVE